MTNVIKRVFNTKRLLLWTWLFVVISSEFHPHTDTNYWDCNPSGDCWCKKMPNVVPISGSECVSPTKLKKLIEEENEKT